MTERINQNQAFLGKLISVTVAKAKKELLSCSDEEFKAVVECIINSKLLTLSPKEKKVSLRCKNLLKFFSKKVIIKKRSTLKYLVLNIKFLRQLLTCFLGRLTEEALICLYSSS